MRGVLEWPNFKEVTQFLKSNQISLAYGLTSNEDQAIKNALFSCYIEEYVDFVPFSDALGDGLVWPL